MIYIGIDPDVEKSGVAIWDSSRKRFLDITELNFFDTLNTLQKVKPNKIIIEAGFLIPIKNWHKADNKGSSDTIAYQVGRNQQVAYLLGEFCERMKMKFQFVPPKGKITKELFKTYTGIDFKHKSDQDKIDAAMLVFGY